MTAATLVAAGTTDVRSVRETIWPRFLAETGLDAALEYRQDVSTPRLLAALRETPGGTRPDVVFVSNPASLAAAGLAMAIDVAEYGAFPAGWLDGDGRWCPLYVQPVVAVHNSHRSTPPRGWQDLGDARFADRLCFEEPWRMLTTGPGLAELSSTMDEAAWALLVGALIAQRPLIVGDNERSVLEVATGSRWVGLSNWNVALRVRPGSLVRHVFLDPTPCIPGFGVLVEGGREPALGARFLRWLAGLDGQRAYAATGRVPARPDLDAATALRRVLPPDVTPLCGTTGWVADPQPWAERLAGLFGKDLSSREPVRQAKLALT